MKFNISKEWCEQASKIEEPQGLMAINPELIKENNMNDGVTVTIQEALDWVKQGRLNAEIKLGLEPGSTAKLEGIDEVTKELYM